VVAASVLFFALALALRVGLMVALPNVRLIPRREMERVARSWADTGSLANPYATPTGPTAHVAPVYPILLGTLYRIFGTGSKGLFAQAILSCVLCALRSALVLPLALALGLTWRTGVLAAALSIPYINAFNTELRGPWDAPMGALLLIAVVWTASRFSQKPSFSLGSAVPLGLFSGAVLLACPAFLPMLVLFVAAAAFLRRSSLKRFSLWLLVFIPCAGVVLAPWALRNLRVLGSPVIFRSNFGLELSLAYNDAGYTSALDQHVLDPHPVINPAASREVASLGEVEFNKRRQQEALRWIYAHPGQSVRLFAIHVVDFWFPPAEIRMLRIALAALTIVAWLGWLVLYFDNRKAAFLLGIVWAGFPLIYYVTYWSSRYRYPMDWTLLLTAAVLVDFLWGRFARLTHPAFTTPQSQA
jgi:hypothetical protein